jgi:hypothetical protein
VALAAPIVEQGDAGRGGVCGEVTAVDEGAMMAPAEEQDGRA